MRAARPPPTPLAHPPTTLRRCPPAPPRGPAPPRSRTENDVAAVSVEPSAAAAPSPAPAASLPPPRFTVPVSSREARAGLRVDEIFDDVLDAPTIVVTAVAGAGDLAAAGVRPGLRLLSLPHPTRRGERWELAPGSAPVSRVRDLLRVYRGVELDLEFSVDPVSDAAIDAWLATKARREQDAEDAAAAAAASSLAADVASGAPAGPDAGDAEREARALARRLRRRAERNAAEAARDDTPLIVGATVAFLGPAAIILGVAASTGYLDRLRDNLSF